MGAIVGAVLMSVDNSNTIVRAVRAARHSYIIGVSSDNQHYTNVAQRDHEQEDE